MEIISQKVTAVLPAGNCRGALSVCLSALSAGDCPPQIIVVDDGSGDGTAQMVREKWPSAVLLSMPAHTGFAHAANTGLRLVRTEYALLIRPELQPGRTCVRRLLEAMEGTGGARKTGEKKNNKTPDIRPVFCAIPQASRRAARMPLGKRPGRSDPAPEAPAETLDVPDGCALYRMKTLEEIGWLDERHFDGLEALDLSLRAAARGFRTVRVPGACVRPAEKSRERAETGRCRRAKRSAISGEAEHSLREPRNEYGVRENTLRRQLAVGNRRYLIYKHIPAFFGCLPDPLPAVTGARQKASFFRRGEADAYRMALVRGKALCSLERERREAREEGAGVWAETLPDAAFLGMEPPADRMYPLFLAEKEPFSAARIPDYLRIRRALLGRRAVRDI